MVRINYAEYKYFENPGEPNMEEKKIKLAVIYKKTGLYKTKKM